MNPIFFKSGLEFRKWLQKNHKKEKEVLVGFHKVKTGKPSMSWSESVDEALCFGWIDGVRRSINEDAYMIRFTPRNAKSNWSAINMKKIGELTKQGRMQPAGLEAYNKREEKRSAIYLYENDPLKLSLEFEKQFKANKKAWSFFEAQAPWYKKLTIGRVMTAKQEATRFSRFEKLIKASAEGRRLI